MVVTCGPRVAAMAWWLSSRRGDVEALALPPAPSKRSEASCLAASCPRPAAGAKSIGEGRDTDQERRTRREGQLLRTRRGTLMMFWSAETARSPRDFRSRDWQRPVCGAPLWPLRHLWRQKKNAMLVCVDTLDFGPLWFWRRAIARYLPPLIKRRSQGLASTRLRCRAFARGAYNLSLIHISEPTRP